MVRTKQTFKVTKAAAAAAAGKQEAKVQKPRRARSGKAAMREAKRLQQRADFLLKRKPFIALVREVTASLAYGGGNDMRFQKKGFDALQVATEAFLHDMFREAHAAMVHSGRQTMQLADLKYAVRVLNHAAAHDSFDVIRSKKVSSATVKPAPGVKGVSPVPPAVL